MGEIQDFKDLDITPELALSAARVLKEWCKKGGVYCRQNGERCIFREVSGMCSSCEMKSIDEWDLPERKSDE